MAALHPALVEARVLDALERNSTGALATSGVPGLQVTVCIGDRPPRTFAAGAACLARGNPVTPRTRFRIASLSKPVAALALARAGSSRLIDLDAPVEPELSHVESLCANPWLRTLTLRQLLSHSSGIIDAHVPHVPEGTPRPSLLESLNGALGVAARFEREPGEASVYSGLNYALAEYVCTVRLGRAFSEMVAQLVPGAEFGIAARSAPEVASEHDPDGRVLPHQIPVAFASSGQVASSEELAVVMHDAMMHAVGDRTSNDPVAGSAAQLFTLQPTVQKPKFSLGLHRLGRCEVEVWDHYGHRPGLRCALNIIPSARLTIVALSNGERGTDVIDPILAMVRGICEHA
ncbi:MAG TPA: serine hydrolase domain-containing protein [Phycisphaerales bacterium]|nr:serine hydrolase domain-containing protein [Phycisphaerales bacterium]